MSAQKQLDLDKPTNSLKNLSGTKRRRYIIRYFAASMATVVAVVYFMIGFQIVSVIDKTEEQLFFALPAALVYALGVFLLIRFDRRDFWIAGALFQVFVIFMYFNRASIRIPDFEFWGVFLRIPQMLLFVTLAYLATYAPARKP